MFTQQQIKKYFVIVIFVSFVFVCFTIDGIAKDPEYPTKPIEFIISFGAGGTTDLACRALCEGASKNLPQPIVPINKPGGGGTIGPVLIKNAKPDGYTIGVFTQSAAFIAPLTQDTPYDTLRDFTPIVHFGEYVVPLLVREDKPWRTWKELVEWARKNPGGIRVGFPGSRHTMAQGIALYQVESKENLKFSYIPFKSGTETLTALLGDNINLFGASVDASSMDYINMGKIRVLLFVSNSKLPGYENIPSTEEMYGVSHCNLIGIVGPKGLPSYVTKRLEDALTIAIKDPSFASVMKKMNTAIVYMTGEKMGKYIEKTYIEQKEIIKRLKEEEAKK